MRCAKWLAHLYTSLGTDSVVWIVFQKYVNVAGAVIPLSDKIKILGATLDANLTMAPHIKVMLSSWFYHICSFRQIPSSLDDSMAVSVASALISSRLDQLNSIPYGTPLHTAHLQRIQRSTARFVLYQYSHVSPQSSDELLKQFYSLPTEWHIRFKVATLTFKALHGGRLTYLSDLLLYHESMRSLAHPVSVPCHNLTFRSRTFRFPTSKSLEVSMNLSHFLLLNFI